jgi:hypothetical protein
MHFPVKRLASVVMITALAMTATAATARDFRSADVHSKDFPTNMAVKHIQHQGVR